MPNFVISTAARNAMCDALVDLLDAGVGAGTLKTYTASQPAGPGTAISTQTLLATLTYSDPAFGAAASGVATASAITDDSSADATGTAAWARSLDSNGLAVFDCQITATGGGGDLTFNTVSFTAGDAVSITSFTISVPAS